MIKEGSVLDEARQHHKTFPASVGTETYFSAMLFTHPIFFRSRGTNPYQMFRVLFRCDLQPLPTFTVCR